VKAFKNPEEALEFIVSGRCPDLIITYQRMPEMSGVDLLREVGKAHPHCVGFILSGFTERADLLGAINRAPVVGYVTKPWKIEELKESVEQAIRISQKKLATKNMSTKLNALRTEIRGLKVVLKKLTDEGAELQDPRVQDVRGKMITLRDRLSDLTKSTAPSADTLKPEMSRPAAALGASAFTNNS
jgi:response regulator RpfG family c-di-GMP phosphodiesterase